jgi:hypothetical protein
METNPTALFFLYLVSGIVVGFLVHETWNDFTFWWKEYKLRKNIKKGDKE